LERFELVLAAFFGPVVRPALALERIETQVDQIRHVNMGLLTQPALGLVDEAILVVVDASRTDAAFAEIEGLVTRRRTLAGDQGGLIVTDEMVLVGTVTEFHTFKQ